MSIGGTRRIEKCLVGWKGKSGRHYKEKKTWTIKQERKRREYGDV